MERAASSLRSTGPHTTSATGEAAGPPLRALQAHADGIEHCGTQADGISAVGAVRAPLRERVTIFAEGRDEQVACPAPRIERHFGLQAEVSDQLIVRAPALAQMFAEQ